VNLPTTLLFTDPFLSPLWKEHAPVLLIAVRRMFPALSFPQTYGFQSAFLAGSFPAIKEVFAMIETELLPDEEGYRPTVPVRLLTYAALLPTLRTSLPKWMDADPNRAAMIDSKREAMRVNGLQTLQPLADDLRVRVQTATRALRHNQVTRTQLETLTQQCVSAWNRLRNAIATLLEGNIIRLDFPWGLADPLWGNWSAPMPDPVTAVRLGCLFPAQGLTDSKQLDPDPDVDFTILWVETRGNAYVPKRSFYYPAPEPRAIPFYEDAWRPLYGKPTTKGLGFGIPSPFRRLYDAFAPAWVDMLRSLFQEKEQMVTNVLSRARLLTPGTGPNLASYIATNLGGSGSGPVPGSALERDGEYEDENQLVSPIGTDYTVYSGSDAEAEAEGEAKVGDADSGIDDISFDLEYRSPPRTPNPNPNNPNPNSNPSQENAFAVALAQVSKSPPEGRIVRPSTASPTLALEPLPSLPTIDSRRASVSATQPMDAPLFSPPPANSFRSPSYAAPAVQQDRKTERKVYSHPFDNLLLDDDDMLALPFPLSRSNDNDNENDAKRTSLSPRPRLRSPNALLLADKSPSVFSPRITYPSAADPYQAVGEEWGPILFHPFQQPRDDEEGGPRALPFNVSLPDLVRHHAIWQTYRTYWAGVYRGHLQEMDAGEDSEGERDGKDVIPISLEFPKLQLFDEDKDTTLSGDRFQLPIRHISGLRDQDQDLPPCSLLSFRDHGTAEYYVSLLMCYQHVHWYDATTQVTWDAVPALYTYFQSSSSGSYIIVIERIETLDWVLTRNRKTLAAADLFRIMNLPLCFWQEGSPRELFTDTPHKDFCCAWRAVPDVKGNLVPQRQWYLLHPMLDYAPMNPGQPYTILIPKLIRQHEAFEWGRTMAWTTLDDSETNDFALASYHIRARTRWYMQAMFLLHPKLVGTRLSLTGRASACAYRLVRDQESEDVVPIGDDRARPRPRAASNVDDNENENEKTTPPLQEWVPLPEPDRALKKTIPFPTFFESPTHILFDARKRTGVLMVRVEIDPSEYVGWLETIWEDSSCW
jgi:hypothetical protein